MTDVTHYDDLETRSADQRALGMAQALQLECALLAVGASREDIAKAITE